MFRAFILSVALLGLLGACARPEPQTTAADVARMEAANAEVVYAAVIGCGESYQNVSAHGAHGWDIDEAYEETLTEHQLLDLESCVQGNITVAQGAADVNLLSAITLSPAGEYAYRAAFLAGKTADEMLIIDRGLIEAIDRRAADYQH